MDVVGHHDEGIQINPLTHLFGFFPFLLDNFPKGIQNDFSFGNFAEQTLPKVGANGHEISPGLSIVIFLQPNGAAI
jgi:hypothetical protein